jgi:hypothetical protein
LASTRRQFLGLILALAVGCSKSQREAEIESSGAGEDCTPAAQDPAPVDTGAVYQGPPTLKVQGGPPGGSFVVTIEGIPDVECTGVYTPPQGSRIAATQVSLGKTDCRGNLRWTTRIEAGTNLGNGQISVSCGGPESRAAVPIG